MLRNREVQGIVTIVVAIAIINSTIIDSMMSSITFLIATFLDD